MKPSGHNSKYWFSWRLGLSVGVWAYKGNSKSLCPESCTLGTAVNGIWAAASTEPCPCSIHLFVVVSVFTVVVVVNAVARGTAGGGEEYEKDDDRSQHWEGDTSGPHCYILSTEPLLEQVIISKYKDSSAAISANTTHNLHFINHLLQTFVSPDTWQCLWWRQVTSAVGQTALWILRRCGAAAAPPDLDR